MVPAFDSASAPHATRDLSRSDDPQWYKDAVIYQLHVRGFFDRNDDGIGDFDGLTERLDYIQALGVSAIWLQPFYPSPLKDDGYDIGHYQGIHPSYGTRRDFAEFMHQAHRRGLRVITELVINHTSDQHAWFQAARRAKPGSSKRNFYVWSDDPTRYAGVPIIFKDTEPSNWTWDPVAGAYYWHRFFHHQPDLNFDNPQVRKAVLKVMRFWLDLGVDGMRLDAVPYLVERDGTQCANLPETHAVLKEIRRELDARYRNRMLLAEANQWPSDVRTYFGDDDECHMAFHFPLMPRLYMALRQEDRHPLSELLWQMPSIPDGCQWALFLRNHDELTLEMVSDDERDYMYQTYAADPQMRLNVGIRRRLAPLLENSRARIELMNGLLLSLPGTPVLYYGDELGMGDNVYLGDRNGVRTPMQWNADRNGGFSRADPARLYAPAIMDSVYGYQAVNVEAQERSPHSLLHWMRRIIALRQRHPIFGRGTMELLRPVNRHIFAFIRRLDGHDPVLVVANLARTVQAVSLDLSRVAGLVPVEMTGGVDLPRITDAPYFLTLGPHGFLWLLLQKESPARAAGTAQPVPEPEPEQTPLLVGPEWHTLLDGSVRALLARNYLPQFLRRQPWFSGSGAVLARVEIRDWGVLASQGTEPVMLVILAATLDTGAVEEYALPLTAAADERATEVLRQSPDAVVARLAGARRGALHARLDGAAGRALVSAVMAGRPVRMRNGSLVPTRLPQFDQLRLPARIEDLRSEPFDAEYQHSAAAFGERVMLRCVRRLRSGPSPEAEIAVSLHAEGALARVPPAGGVVGYVREGVTSPIALLEAYVPHQSNAWKMALEQLSRFFESPAMLNAAPDDATDDGQLWEQDVPPQAAQHIGADVQLARTIGQRAAQLHRALRLHAGADRAAVQESGEALRTRLLAASAEAHATMEALATTPGMTDEVRQLAGSLTNRDTDIRNAIEDAANQLAHPFVQITIHGRLDLGHILVHEQDVTFIGTGVHQSIAPATPRQPQSPMADVASLLRSWSVAAEVALQRQLAVAPAPQERWAAWAHTWARWMATSFLSGYRTGLTGDALEPATPQEGAALLRLHVWDAVLSEVRVAANRRPEVARWSLDGLAALVDSRPAR